MLKNWKMEALSIKETGVVIAVIKKRMKVGNGGAKAATRTRICRTHKGDESAHAGSHDTWSHRVLTAVGSANGTRPGLNVERGVLTSARRTVGVLNHEHSLGS